MSWSELTNALSGLLGALIGTAGTLLVWHLERRQTHRERMKKARYRLLVNLKHLQNSIGQEVARVQNQYGDDEDIARYNDAISKLALNYTTSGLQDKILDVLRENDDLPELTSIREALWCPRASAQEWLSSIKRAIADLEEMVCPNLLECEKQLYRQLPANVRRVIEYPETIGQPCKCGR